MTLHTVFCQRLVFGVCIWKVLQVVPVLSLWNSLHSNIIPGVNFCVERIRAITETKEFNSKSSSLAFMKELFVYADVLK